MFTLFGSLNTFGHVNSYALTIPSTRVIVEVNSEGEGYKLTIQGSGEEYLHSGETKYGVTCSGCDIIIDGANTDYKYLLWSGNATVLAGSYIFETGSSSGVTIYANYGYIEVSKGIVEHNYGTIENVQEGRVVSNEATGIILYNNYFGRVTDNSGIVYYNGNPNITISGTGEFIGSHAPTEMYYENWPEPEPEPEQLAPIVIITETVERIRTYAEAYMDSLDDLCAELVSMSGAASNETKIVYYSTGDSLPIEIFETLKNCPNVVLDFKCTYEEKDYHFMIKGGKDLFIDPEVRWCGPLYLQKIYGLAK